MAEIKFAQCWGCAAEAVAFYPDEGGKRMRGYCARCNPNRRPGVVERVTWYVLRHLSVVAAVSLVGWLLALALAALLLLPGCSDPGAHQREHEAFDSVQRFIVHEAEMLEAKAISPEQFVKDVREILDALREGVQAEREAAGASSWIELLGTALGGGGVVGAGLTVVRNRSRRREFASLEERIEKKRGGAP